MITKRPAVRGRVRGKRVNRSKNIFAGTGVKSRSRAVRIKNTENRRIFALVTMLSLFAIAVAGGIGFLLWHEVPVITDEPISIFMGDELPNPNDWFIRLRSEAEFSPVSQAIDTWIPGEFKLTLIAANRSFGAVLIIVDNVPPTADTVSLTVPVGKSVTPSDFYTNLFDHSETESVFVTAPDTDYAGIHEVVVSITDSYGNELLIETLCEVFEITEEIVIERGTEMSVSDFTLSDFTSFCEDTLLDFEREVRLILNFPENFTSEVGEYTAIILIQNERFYSTVRIVVTTPPEAEPRTVRRFVNEPNAAVEADRFVRIIRDESIDADSQDEYTIEFVEEPDWTVEGTREVVVRVSDEWGNYTDVTATLELLLDTTPPVIHGARDFSILLGTAATFRSGVTVTDDLDPEPQLTVNSREVNVNQLGIYQVTYTARDRAGNQAEPVVINVHVIDITAESLYNLADNVLRDIGVYGTDNQFEQVRLIHRHLNRYMGYQNNPSSPSDEVRFAYNVLRLMRGDCLAFQRAAEALFNRAGIANMRIDNRDQSPRVRHSWNLVQINGDWYHFDASRFFDCGYTNTHVFTAGTATQLNRTRSSVYTFNTENYPEIHP
jgi:hypothetical protein